MAEWAKEPGYDRGKMVSLQHHEWQPGKLWAGMPRLSAYIDPGAVMRRAAKALHGLHCWVSSGTALGLARDGDFIPWDRDIDFGLLGDWDSPPDAKAVAERLFAAGFQLLRGIIYDGRIQSIAFADGEPFWMEHLEEASKSANGAKRWVDHGLVVDLYWYYAGKEPGCLVNVNDLGVMRKKPPEIFDKIAPTWTPHGIVPMPEDLEGYLVMRYGPGWATPNRESRGIYDGT